MAKFYRNPKNRIRMTREETIYQVVIVSIVGLVVLLCIFPFLYVVGMSFTSEGEMISRNYFVIIPRKPIFRSYELVFALSGIWRALLVSAIRTVLGAAAALVLTVPGGYILAKRDLAGRVPLLIFFIITMILGGGLIPRFLLMGYLDLIDSFWVYIIPLMGATFNMLVVKVFVENMPEDIMESAELDGATELQKMFFIAIPLLVPTICALSLFAAVAHWNSWFDVMLYIRNTDLYTLSYVVKRLMEANTSIDYALNIPADMRMMPEGLKMASVVIAVIPILCVYPFLQKYFIYGVYMGSVKG